MTIKSITLIFAITMICKVNAQDKKNTFQINKGEAIISVQRVVDKGVIIKTGKNGKYSENSKDLNWHLRYFDLDLNLIWDMPIQKEIVDARYSNRIIADCSGSKIYHIEKYKKPGGNIINQIALDGELKKHQINKTKWKTLPKFTNACFANDSLLCIIFSEYSDITPSKKKILNGELTLFKKWVHTITNDNGKEFAGHEKIAFKLDCSVFFAHPYSSWERGLNEYTNKLLRQYFPKNKSLLDIDIKEILKATERLNNRPRKKLGFKTPKQVFYQYIYQK